MNKRLLLALYDRSGLGAYMPVDYKGHELAVEEHWEKFAELIVRECRDIVEQDMKLAHIQMIPLTLERYANGRLKEKIREHFGVEECWCESCKPNTMTDMRMILCQICGNKRCPHATNHIYECTNSNEPGQKGSSWENYKVGVEE